jgi:hypothetical protein
MLSGGAGYVFGTFFGVLVLGVTQALIQFIGSLSSWWTKIVIGALTLIFIGVQTVLATRKSGRGGVEAGTGVAAKRRKQQRLALGFGVLLVMAISAGLAISRSRSAISGEVAVTAPCAVEFREADLTSLIKDGAVMAYQRVAGPQCVDELYAIYADGRITGTDGVNKVEKQVTSAEVDQMLTSISVDHGWFTNEIYDTYLTPCRQCFAHYILISYDGQEKGVTGTDGTTAMPPGYAFALAEIRPLLPEIKPAP